MRIGQTMYRIAQLLYLMLPIYLANMAPPWVRFWRGWNRPIHERLLGSHKTVMGVIFALTAALLTTFCQSLVIWEGALLDTGRWAFFGLLLGGSAMAGDCLKSLIKRRLGIAPGESWIVADQLDFVFAGLIAVSPWVNLGASDIALVLVVSFVGDLLINRVAHWFGIRETPL